MNLIGCLIEEHIKKEEYSKARYVILKALKKDKENHWLITRLSLTYYEEHEYQKALKWSEQAIRLAPQCPLVLWDFANILDMMGQENEAIRIYKRLLARGEEDIAYGECGEGIRWARSLLNDCRYRIALAYRDLGRHRMALRYLKEHMENRSPGTPSIYPLAEVKKKLAQLQEQYKSIK